MSAVIYVSYPAANEIGEPYKFDIDYYLNTHMQLVQKHWYVPLFVLVNFGDSPYLLLYRIDTSSSADYIQGATRVEKLVGSAIRG